MTETARINYWIYKYGILGAKKEAIKVCHLYFEYLHKLHRGKHPDTGQDTGPVMTMYYNSMRKSISLFLDFIES